MLVFAEIWNGIIKVNGYTFRGSNSSIFILVYLLNEGSLLTILHSEQPKLHRVLAILSAIGLKDKKIFLKFSTTV